MQLWQRAGRSHLAATRPQLSSSTPPGGGGWPCRLPAAATPRPAAAPCRRAKVAESTNSGRAPPGCSSTLHRPWMLADLPLARVACSQATMPCQVCWWQRSASACAPALDCPRAEEADASTTSSSSVYAIARRSWQPSAGRRQSGSSESRSPRMSGCPRRRSAASSAALARAGECDVWKIGPLPSRPHPPTRNLPSGLTRRVWTGQARPGQGATMWQNDQPCALSLRPRPAPASLTRADFQRRARQPPR